VRGPALSTKRIYAPAERSDGIRVLVMRLWPRGIRKDRVDMWLKELGPVRPLLRDFLDKRVRWETYVKRYLAGLERPEAQADVEQVLARARRGRVTLLCGCPDENRCHRTLLKAYLAERLL
jgi:uncharacterized protein YeaO (DUF488 family)